MSNILPSEEDKVMVIKLPYYMKPETRKKKLDEILADKERGVIIVPYGAEVSFISKDVKIEMTDARDDTGNRCLKEIDLMRKDA